MTPRLFQPSTYKLGQLWGCRLLRPWSCHKFGTDCVLADWANYFLLFTFCSPRILPTVYSVPSYESDKAELTGRWQTCGMQTKSSPDWSWAASLSPPHVPQLISGVIVPVGQSLGARRHARLKGCLQVEEANDSGSAPSPERIGFPFEPKRPFPVNSSCLTTNKPEKTKTDMIALPRESVGLLTPHGRSMNTVKPSRLLESSTPFMPAGSVGRSRYPIGLAD